MIERAILAFERPEAEFKRYTMFSKQIPSTCCLVRFLQCSVLRLRARCCASL